MEELPDYYEVLGIKQTATSRYNGFFQNTHVRPDMWLFIFLSIYLHSHLFLIIVLPPSLLSFLLTTKSEIRDGYKLRALETHPDRYPIIDSSVTREEATKAFQKVADAYYVLSNPQQKEKYGMGYRRE